MAHKLAIGQMVELAPRHLRSSAPRPYEIVISFPPWTAIRATLATTSRALAKNMNGSHLKAI